SMSLRSSPSTSSVRNAGGISPTNAPQQASITGRCSFGVKLSIDDNHQTQAADPTNPVASQTCRSDRRWYRVVRKVVIAIVTEVGTINHPEVIRGYPRNSVQYMPMMVSTATKCRSI